MEAAWSVQICKLFNDEPADAGPQAIIKRARPGIRISAGRKDDRGIDDLGYRLIVQLVQDI